MVSVGSINNVSLNILQTNAINMNGTEQQCLCVLTHKTSLFFGFNYFSDNSTCQMHSKSDQNKSFTLVNDGTSVFYFLSLPYYTPPWSNTRYIERVTSNSIGELLRLDRSEEDLTH